MYNVKGPSKIVAKTARRGISQNVDNIREYTRNKSVETEDNDIQTVPKPVFHKKSMPNHHSRHENISPQHEELIKFIHNSWNNVIFPESSDSSDTINNNNSKVVQCLYYEDEPCIELEGFKPFDLESWWTKHAYAYFTGAANDILQQNSGTHDVSRTNSQVDLSSSCSTMSIVHLQYKYEELLNNHHGLLKLLEMKSDEIKKVHTENSSLKSEMEDIQQNLASSSQKIKKIHQKMVKMREKKDSKIRKLKTYKETLQLAHSQLVNLLHNQFMEKDDSFLKEIKVCKHSYKTLILQEIRKNNMLSYENIQLHQKVKFLTALLDAERKINKSQSKTTCATTKKQPINSK